MKTSKATILFALIIFSITGCGQSKINTQKVEELLKDVQKHKADEILIQHKGKEIAYWVNKDCDDKVMRTASMVKSWTGLVVGIMIDKQLIKDENELVCKYIPEWKDGCEHNVTIKNLLTMSAGFNRRPGATGILPQKNVNSYMLNTKIDTLPNVRFSYSNESVQLLGILIERVTKKTANAYYKEVLFNPLGMTNTRLTKDKSGNYLAFGAARTTVKEAAKIGDLMMNNGVYNGKRIVSEEWVKKSTQPSEKASYYGYLWWLDYNSKHKNFAATGDFGQVTIVFPELDLVFVRRQSCNKNPNENMSWMSSDFLKLLSEVVAE